MAVTHFARAGVSRAVLTPTRPGLAAAAAAAAAAATMTNALPFTNGQDGDDALALTRACISDDSRPAAGQLPPARATLCPAAGVNQY